MKDLPNILLIVLDTLRKDTLYANLDKLPNFRLLLESSTSYENAISPSPWTIPSHASMFTGRYPIEHRMTYHYDDEEFFRSIASIPGDEDTIQERLHARGYDTISLAANPLVGKGSAFDVNFDFSVNAGPFQVQHDYNNMIAKCIDAPVHGLLEAPVSAETPKLEFIRKFGIRKSLQIYNLVRRKEGILNGMNFPREKGSKEIIRALKDKGTKDPFFLFVNLLEMHEPYVAVENFGDIVSTSIRHRTKTPNGYTGKFEFVKQALKLMIS